MDIDHWCTHRIDRFISLNSENAEVTDIQLSFMLRFQLNKKTDLLKENKNKKNTSRVYLRQSVSILHQEVNKFEKTDITFTKSCEMK